MPAYATQGARGRGPTAQRGAVPRDRLPRACVGHKIESTFDTVRLRTKVTRVAGFRTAAPAMVFKLVESAEQR